jgi:hypothetical protein
MDTQIEQAIQSKTTSNPELCKQLDINENDLSYFLNQYNIFTTLSKTSIEREYANFFNETNIIELELSQPHQPSTFIKAMSTFINNKMNHKPKFHLKFETEKDISTTLSLLSLIPNADKFKYVISGDKELPYYNYINLFTYVKRYSNLDFFQKTYQYIINNLIEVNQIYYLNLDKVDILKVIEYSKKFPNKINRLYSFDNQEYEKIKEVVELNKDSLIQLPNERLDLYTMCKNIEILDLSSQALPTEIPADFDFTKIKKIKTIRFEDIEDENETNIYLNYFNKCPNLEVLSFSNFVNLSGEFFFSFFPKVNTPNLRKIQANIFDFEENENYDPIFAQFPKLEKLNLEEHDSMNHHYTVSPVFSCENNHISVENLEKLALNYINRNKYNYLRFKLSSDFEEMLEHLKQNEVIMKRVIDISMYGSDGQIDEELRKCQSCIKMNHKDVTYKYNSVKGMYINNPNIDVTKMKEFLLKVQPECVISNKLEIDVKELLTTVENMKIAVSNLKKKVYIRNNYQNNGIEEYDIIV